MEGEEHRTAQQNPRGNGEEGGKDPESQLGKGKNTFSHSSIQEYEEREGKKETGRPRGEGQEEREQGRGRGRRWKGSYLFRGETLQGAPS